MNGRRTKAPVASPVLIGAVTTIVLFTSVWLAYNANKGLPLLPTYDVSARLPDGAQLVATNDVRIAGYRVGAIDSITPMRRPDGTAYAEVRMKLETRGVKPLPIDSHVIVRSRSALGSKYVEIVPGRSKVGLPEGGTFPPSAATPQPVEVDQVLNTFDRPTRAGVRATVTGLGMGLAGRGTDLNAGIAPLPELLGDVAVVMREVGAPRTRLDRLVPALERTATQLAPVARPLADLVVNADTTFTAVAAVAPALQDTIAATPPTLRAGIEGFPTQQAFLADSTTLMRTLLPGVRSLGSSAPTLAGALEAGTPVLRDTPAVSKRLTTLFVALQDFSDNPVVPLALGNLDRLLASLGPTLNFVTPAQTTCNYVTLWFRNVASVLSDGGAGGTWQRFIIIPTPEGPNNEGGPSDAPADGPSQANHLHANTYPNVAAPGQTHECESGNEPYAVGKTIVANPPGNQGIVTEGQGR